MNKVCTSSIPVLKPRPVRFAALGSRKLTQLRDLWHGVQFIVLDEVSMLPYHLLVAIHQRLCQLKGNNDLFGGLNVLAFGDLCQLRPPEGVYVFDDDPSFQQGLHLWQSVGLGGNPGSSFSAPFGGRRT